MKWTVLCTLPWLGLGVCWCGDGTCNDYCRGSVHGTVYNFEMPDGFCAYESDHPEMTHQEKCCACPQWGCADSWSKGDTSACEGLIGTCDFSMCGILGAAPQDLTVTATPSTSSCWCNDGTCQDTCRGTVNQFQMVNGFCYHKSIHSSMTDQEKCCACPAWGCADSWSKGDTSACGGLVGTCDLSICGRVLVVCECWERVHHGFGCSLGDPVAEQGMSLEQCADGCYSSFCSAIEYDSHQGRCAHCRSASAETVNAGREVWQLQTSRRLDGPALTTSEPDVCSTWSSSSGESCSSDSCICFWVERFNHPGMIPEKSAFYATSISRTVLSFTFVNAWMAA
eukprot:Skav203759  [mRNA]  locus=scaffold68:711632:712648:+ [translate_table: standard]